MPNGLKTNTLLLHKLLINRPEPRSLPLPPRFFWDGHSPRLISAENELKIVNALIYLSSYSNDANKAFAFGIEEQSNDEALDFSLAANGGLKKLRNGVQRIAGILMNEAQESKQENESRLLKRVVEFNRRRLMSSLGSQHTSIKTKHALFESLDTAIEVTVFSGNSKKRRKALKLVCQRLQDEFDQIEQLTREEARSNQADDMLLSILRGVQELVKEHRLHDLLTELDQRNILIRGQRPADLYMVFRKLTFYPLFCSTLLRFARRYRAVFKTIKVAVVSHQSYSVMPDDCQSLLHTYLAHKNKERKLVLKRLSKELDAPVNTILHSLEDRLAVVGHCIHPEIQLALYYESLSRSCLLPRVIGTSKAACYLCHLFLEAHGRFYTPKTNGRIDPLWTLPDPQGLNLDEQRRSRIRQARDRLNWNICEKILAIIDNPVHPENPKGIDTSVVESIYAPASTIKPSVVSSAQHVSEYVSVSPLASPEGTTVARRVAPLRIVQSRSLTPTAPVPPVAELQSSLGEADSKCSLCVSGEPTELSRCLGPHEEIHVTFSKYSAPVRIHAAGIHLELSYGLASSIVSASGLNERASSCSEVEEDSVSLWVGYYPLDEASSFLKNRAGLVDLEAAWDYQKFSSVLHETDGITLLNRGYAMRLGVDRTMSEGSVESWEV